MKLFIIVIVAIQSIFAIINVLQLGFGDFPIECDKGNVVLAFFIKMIFIVWGLLLLA